jgi:hypothetical protein
VGYVAQFAIGNPQFIQNSALDSRASSVTVNGKEQLMDCFWDRIIETKIKGYLLCHTNYHRYRIQMMRWNPTSTRGLWRFTMTSITALT